MIPTSSSAPARTPAAGLDVAALASYLRTRLPRFESPLRIEPLAGGQSNPTFRLWAGGVAYVLRKKPAGELLPSAHAVDREYRVITALAETDVPVPRTFLYCDDAKVVGTPFYVMEYVEGRTFWDPALPDLAPAVRAAVWDEINRVIAALHCVDYRAVGLEDFGRPGNYFERQIARWSRQYRASETGSIPAMDRLMEWLPENIPPDDRTSIVHGDFRIDNLIFDPAEPRVLAVLDWELSTLGHPLADFAYHVMAWRLTAEQFRGMAGRDLHALGIPSERDYVRAYCRRTAQADIDPAQWEFYLAFSMFRMVAILQGIAKRALEGTAASREAIETGARARPVAEVAWSLVERSRVARAAGR